MGKAARRRAYKLTKYLLELKQSDEAAFNRRLAFLLGQWQRDARTRASRWTYAHGEPTPAAWDLCEENAYAATKLGLKDELVELCRQAVARAMGNKVQLNSTAHLALRAACQVSAL